MASRYWQQIWHYVQAQPLRLPPQLATHKSGGTNLEIFKFGLYIMFPIGWMYYFGTNLDTRFSVPDFWPEPGTTHKLPFEKEELKEMSEQLKAQRLERRKRRLENAKAEMGGAKVEETAQVDEQVEEVEPKRQDTVPKGSFGFGFIGK